MISSCWAITAKHCLDDSYNDNDYILDVGSHFHYATFDPIVRNITICDYSGIDMSSIIQPITYSL